jgi:hypothetical protein
MMIHFDRTHRRPSKLGFTQPVKMLRSGVLAGACLLAVFACAGEAFAWGASGHEMVSGLAVENLPQEVPPFLRTRRAADEIALLGRELDRSRGAGREHDAERDPGHFIDLADDGAVMGIVQLSQLPSTREEYDALMRVGGQSQYKGGYLPYAIIDGWQQIVKDFAYWRCDRVAAGNARTGADRAWFAADLRLREMLTLRDIGVWSHYVGDASQPMHVSVHYNGWDRFPDPMSYSHGSGVHAFFEGAFVRAHMRREAIAAAMAPFQACGCTIEQRTQTYLAASLAQVEPLYRLVSAGAFAEARAEGVDFATQRLAAGAAQTRDMIVEAWRASASASIGYPAISVSDVEAGRVVLTRLAFGGD